MKEYSSKIINKKNKILLWNYKEYKEKNIALK